MAKRINKPLVIKRFMENNHLGYVFVLQAITSYAVQQLDAPDWEGTPIVNQGAWRQMAQAALEAVSDNCDTMSQNVT